MIRKLISFISFLLALSALTAQTPQNIRISGKTGGVVLREPQACNEAGTVRFGQHFGQSNDVSSNIIYLCFGDSLRLIHDGNASFTGDPNPATPPGIGYVFYDCAPSTNFSGPDLATVLQDPCLNKTSPIRVNGVDIPQLNGIWVASGQRNGNLTITNNGLLQSAYKNGAPVQFWFAPITLDNFARQEFESTGGGPSGPCVDVNTEEAFSVVYLNPIAIGDLDVNASPNGCRGTFALRGGLPEFDSMADYQIRIFKEDNPAIQARIIGDLTPSNGDSVEFFVPEPGNYVIEVEDGKSCGNRTVIDMSACQAVIFNLPFINARPGDNICLDVTVENFQDIALFQGTVAWDSRVLQFTGVQNLNPLLANSNETFENPSPDTLTFLWFDPLNGVTLDSGAVIFQICFRVTGVLGQFSPVRFLNSPTPLEVGNSNDQILGFVARSGQVNISTNPLFVDIQPDSVSCPGLTDGSISVRVAQGTPNYRVSWNTVPSTNPFQGPLVITQSGGSVRIPNLPAGQYAIRIEDSSTPPVVFLDTVRVEQALALGASIQGTQPRCFGESNGQVVVEVSVGGLVRSNLNGFTFRWNNSNLNAPRLDSIASGLYAVTVTDPNGCTATASTTLSQPAPIDLSETITDASCSGATDGGIVLRASGGRSASGSYTFQWDSLGTFTGPNSTVTQLTADTFAVTVIDESGCQVRDSFIVSALKLLTITEVIDNISCFNAANGEILLTGSTTGAPASEPYTFQWQGPGIPAGDSDQGTQSTRTNLGPGVYTVTMVDSSPAGCRVTESYSVTQPDSIAISLVNKTDETCIVTRDGSAQISVQGGTQPYSFLWIYDIPDTTAVDTVATDSLASNLRSGRYLAQVTDANACVDSLEVFINAPAPPQIQPIANDTLACPTDRNGALTANATPGNASITGYRWSNGVSGQTVTNLAPGVYYVTVTAQDQCASVDSAFVVAPAPLRIDSIVATTPTCARDSDGSLTVFASGGTMPYTYVWQGSPRNDTLRFNLYPGRRAGTYNVTVIDANNCEAVSGTGTVLDPPSITVTFSDTAAVSCFEDICDGRATALAVYSDGRTAPFNFSWQSGESAAGASSSAAVQLCAGMQTVTVTDINQCFTVDTINIPSPPAIDIQVTIEPVTCNGLADGRVDLGVSGGTPQYSVLWVESGATTLSINDLAAGTYNAVVTDANGCTKNQRVEIEEPEELQLVVDPLGTSDPSCNGTADGAIAVVYNDTARVNPLGPNPYTWSDGAAPGNSPNAAGLRAGTYSVTLTDIKGCQDSVSVTLTEPTPIIAVIPDPADPRCFGESTVILIDTVFGGNGSNIFDYTYQIDNNGLSFTPDQPATVFAGIHVITIEDPRGCTFIDTLSIDQPEQLRVEFDPDIVVIELGDSTIRLDPIITSSLPIDTYTWSPGNGLSSTNVQRPIVDSLFNNQEYSLTVVDANGCQGRGRVFVRIDKNRNVYIPNIFSPNGDGPNDEFRVFACKGVRRIESALIFDRWGSLVFEAPELFHNCDGGTVIWDGRRGSRDMPTGVYVYMVKVVFIDGIELLYRGDVTLLR